MIILSKRCEKQIKCKNIQTKISAGKEKMWKDGCCQVSVSEKMLVFSAKKIDSEEEKTKFVVKKDNLDRMFSVTKYII